MPRDESHFSQIELQSVTELTIFFMFGDFTVWLKYWFICGTKPDSVSCPLYLSRVSFKTSLNLSHFICVYDFKLLTCQFQCLLSNLSKYQARYSFQFVVCHLKHLFRSVICHLLLVFPDVSWHHQYIFFRINCSSVQ